MLQKVALLIIFICCLALNSDAQNEMFGIRQGYSLWLSKYGIGRGSLKYADGQHFTWDKEVYYRQPVNNKWTIESAIAYYSFKNKHYKDELPVSLRNDIIRSTISLQYDVTYPLLGYMFPFMQGMKSYIGFNTSPNISFNKKIRELADGTTITSRNADVFLMIGFSYTHIIPVSKRLAVSSCLSFNTNAFSKYQPASTYARPNKSISWMMGMGYRL